MGEDIIVYEIRARKEEAERIKEMLREYEGISIENVKINTETRTCLILPALITSQRIIEGDFLGIWLTFFKRKDVLFYRDV